MALVVVVGSVRNSRCHSFVVVVVVVPVLLSLLVVRPVRRDLFLS